METRSTFLKTYIYAIKVVSVSLIACFYGEDYKNTIRNYSYTCLVYLGIFKNCCLARTHKTKHMIYLSFSSLIVTDYIHKRVAFLV